MRRRGGNETSIVEAFEGLRSDYTLGLENRYLPRLTGVDPAGTGADYHFANESHFLKAIERARSFDRENMLIGQAITRLIDNVLQDKIPLDPDTGSPKLDDELYDRWEDWCYSPSACHSRRTHDFHTIAKMSLRAALVDGDIFNLPLTTGQLQPIEAHRVRTPKTAAKNVIHGVGLDAIGAPQRYYVAEETQDVFRRVERVRDMKIYPAFDDAEEPAVFHLFNPKRLSQTRGVSVMAPLVYPAAYHDDMQFAKMVQSKSSSVFAFIFEQSGLIPPTGGAHNLGAQTTETQADGRPRVLEQLAPGMVLYTKPGEKITGFNPNVPNTEWFAHISLLLTIIAVNLGIPVAVLLLDPTKTNFSGWRGAIDQARVGFKEIQRWMVARFFSPVYRWQVRRWLDADPSLQKLASKSKLNPFRHKFNRPKWAYIEPLKDAQADELRLSANLISHTELCDERGDDWDERSTQIVEDRAKLVVKAMESAAEINGKFPDAKLDWRELIGTQRPTAEAADQEEGNEATGQPGSEATK